MKPQSEDIFSAPLEQLFIKKFKDHLKSKHTDASTEECFRQFRAHCKTPLESQQILKDPELIQILRQFFDENPKWQQTIADCLPCLVENKQGCLFGTLSGRVRDDILGLVLDHMLQYPILVSVLDILWQYPGLINSNEVQYYIKFTEYLELVISDPEQRPKLLKQVGTVCSCLQTLEQADYN